MPGAAVLFLLLRRCHLRYLRAQHFGAAGVPVLGDAGEEGSVFAAQAFHGVCEVHEVVRAGAKGERVPEGYLKQQAYLFKKKNH